MWDWETIRGICAIIGTICAIISAICGILTAIYMRKKTVQQPSQTAKAKGLLLNKAFSKKTIWKWIVAFVVSSLIAGSLWTYQQLNPNGDPAQVTSAAHQNATLTPSDNSDNPAPAKANPEDRQPTLIQTPTQTPTPTLHLPPTTIPIPVSPPAPTLALSPTIQPDDEILSVVVDRNPHLADSFDVQVLSALITGADGLSIEIHNATCNNTKHITTEEWTPLRCGYDEETQTQTIMEHILAWHESVGHLRCEADGIPNSSTMQFSCFTE